MLNARGAFIFIKKCLKNENTLSRMRKVNVLVLGAVTAEWKER